ncbi:hypothetical protein SUGI_1199730 [Cryptomeria japonica]|nr:hypothetical protein SUGI_1199730 [Cryptomeria japonica]
MFRRGKGGKGLGKGGAKRHMKVLRDNIQGITKPTIKHMAKRGEDEDVFAASRPTMQHNLNFPLWLLYIKWLSWKKWFASYLKEQGIEAVSDDEEIPNASSFSQGEFSANVVSEERKPEKKGKFASPDP